jgi:polyferredoxin
MVFWGATMSMVATPLLTYFFGKRWYCSWVCGCGGLAETAGDPYRHLSDKSRAAWRWEVRIVYPILALIVLITVLLWVNQLYGSFLGDIGNSLNQFYGFAIGAVFSGVVGVGFYPIMGNRVWCRFGCPMAAYLGLLQKHFSRFRITTNGGQCISCGNCSNVCEMGIDVKQYAQRGEPIIRASCVGCGMCSTACPRGVLNLENAPREGRYQGSQLIHADSLRILS